MGQSLVSGEVTFPFALKFTLAAAKIFDITVFQCVPVQVTLEQSLKTAVWLRASERLLSLCCVCFSVLYQA